MTTPTERIRVGMSACLAGERVRWDGTDRLRQRLVDVIGAMAELVTVCPELELGLGVPREKIRLVDAGGPVRLVGEDSGRDLTAAMAAWAEARLLRADVAGVDGWVLKAGSPSCGLARVKIYDGAGAGAGHRLAGQGLFAAALRARWPELPIADEEGLADETALSAFAASVRAHHAKQAKVQP